MIKKRFIFYTFILIACSVFSPPDQYVSTLTLPLRGENNSLPQEENELPRITHEVEVSVTRVDVIVTDKAGNGVTGLKAENFKIYEDGVAQKLTNFFEVQGMDVYVPSVPYAPTPTGAKEKGKAPGSPASPVPPVPVPSAPSAPTQPLPRDIPPPGNKIIIYFDNWQLHPMNRNWSIKKLASFIQKNFPPGTYNQGMVVSLDQKLEIIQKFTSNQQLLDLAVKEVKEHSGQTLLQKREKEELKKELNRIVTDTTSTDRYEMNTGYERALGQARGYVDSEQNDLFFSLKALNALINDISGIDGKKTLIYVSDGLPINPGDEVFSFLDQAFPGRNARSEAMNYDATRIFKELTARCNANEITLYPINSQGLDSINLSADKEDGWSIYARGSGMAKTGSRVRNDALKMMARDTGGIAILNTNEIEPGLERIKNDLRFYYTLGYRSLYRDDNKYHSLNVKLVGVKENYNIRVRQGYRQISQEERIADSVESHLFLKNQYNPMGVIVQVLPEEPVLISNKIRLTLKLLIPIKNLVLNLQKDDYLGKIKVYTALKDSEERLSPIRELAEEIKIPAKDYETAFKSFYPYLVEMYVDPGSYLISLAVRDMNGVGASYTQVEKVISRRQF